MSQVGQQQASRADSRLRDSIIDIELPATGIGGAGPVASQRPRADDSKPLDTHTLIDAVEVATGVQLVAASDATRPHSHKLHGVGGEHECALSHAKLDKVNYHTDELNNNFIVPVKPQASCPPVSKLSPSQAGPAETPLSLLNSLRMHTSHLRAQKLEQQQQQQHLGATPSDGRKGAKSAASAQEPQKVSRSGATNSPASYVESSLNPPESVATSSARSGSPHIPSYTSIFSQKPPAASSPSPDQHQSATHHAAKLSSPVSSSSYSQHQHLLSESVQISTTTSRPNQSAGSRSPLIKQTGQQQQPPQQQQRQQSDSPARNLFASSSRPIDTSRRWLPSIFDHSMGGRLRQPVDYEKNSAANKRRLLKSQQLETNEDEDMISYQDDNHDDQDQDGHSQRRELDDNSTSSASSDIEKGESEQFGKRLANSSPESQHKAQYSRRAATRYPGSGTKLDSSSKRGSSSARRLDQLTSRPMMSGHSHHQLADGKKLSSQAQMRASLGEMSRPPSFNTTTAQQQQHEQDLDTKVASCRKLDLLEQVAHLNCSCHICAKNRKLTSLHDKLYYYQHCHNQFNTDSASKLSNFNLNKSGLGGERTYPKTRLVHMVLKSIILVLCTLLLLLLLVGGILISHYLPQSMDKVVNASRSFNVTIAGRR